MDEVLSQLLPQVRDAAKKIWHCDDEEACRIATGFEKYMKAIDIEKLVDNEDHGTDVSHISKEYVVELDPYYIGFQSPINMNEFVKRNSVHPIYQIIFEDTAQKLIFEYVGVNYRKLEDELNKLYPGTKIDRSYDDIVVSQAYCNYNVMTNELENMKYRLKLVDPVLSKQCIKKELQPVNGTSRMAIKSRVEPRDYATSMLNIVVNVIKGNVVVIGNNNTVNCEAKPSREQLHKEWIVKNPPGSEELSSKYYDKLKRSIVSPVSIQQHANILRDLDYQRIRNERGSIWVKRV